jgi:hypothetical protein
MESKGQDGQTAMTTIVSPLALLAAMVTTAGLVALCDESLWWFTLRRLS